MLDLILSQTLFYISIAFMLFLPGYFLMLAIWGKNARFNVLEKTVFVFGSSIIIIDFLMLAMGKSNIALNAGNIALTVSLFMFFSSLAYILRKRYGFFKKETSTDEISSFSKMQIFSIITLLLLTIFIKTIYLENTVFPTSTDLGHHMYWSKMITDSGKLPIYEKADIISSEGNYAISEPEPIADFIIGEHLIFSAISLLSGAQFVSAFPSLLLFVINIASVLAIFILALEIFRKHPQGTNIAIMSLFLIGPLYALSSPQAKFVSGGVIGNTLGNFFIPLILFFLIKALREKKPSFGAMTAFLTLGMIYTHHLSTFVFLFSLIFSFALLFLFDSKKIFSHLKEWVKLFFSPSVIFILLFGILMVFFIHTPSYLNASAVDTAVGAPSKSTRTGLTFSQLTSSTGETRMIFGIFGLILILLYRKRAEYGHIFLLGWAVALLVMSLKPALLFVDIPSNRIANYIIFPLTILGSFAFIKLFEIINDTAGSSRSFVKPSYAITLFFVFAAFFSQGGFVDNSRSLSSGGNIQSAVQTFRASGYLAKHIDTKTDVVLKDHNYIVADAWIKLYFTNGYNYPFSRGFFKRYSDETKPREQCTLLMISSPSSKEAEKCFKGTGTDFLMVNPRYDSMQFKKTRNFWQVYSSDEVSIFHKPTSVTSNQ